MPTYPALIDGAKGAYGVTFPDLPGIVAMGQTVDEAILNAKAALNDYAIETQADGDSLAPPTPPDQVADHQRPNASIHPAEFFNPSTRPGRTSQPKLCPRYAGDSESIIRR